MGREVDPAMFSQTVEYALRAMAFLGQRAPEPSTTDEIAAGTRVPKAYLAKVVRELNRSGLVHSRRGLGGGIALAKVPAEVSLLEVINAVEPIRRIAHCPLDLPTHAEGLCPLHRRLDDALGLIEGAFRDTTLAEVLAEPSRSHPLCDATTPSSS